jgi:DNA-binding beta-propeller fold protein YncE
MFYPLLVAIVVLLFTVTPAYAQRAFATVKGTLGEERLNFDTNNVPVADPLFFPGADRAVGDLTFAPNIVFTADSNRGFVSYASSDRVMVFNPKTAEVEALVQVGKNPLQITMTPDGKTLAVVCLFIDDMNLNGDLVGAVYLIDAATLQTRAMDFREARSPATQWAPTVFSFANNVVFSSDGKTGYVGSAGTDKIIRFSVDNAQEIGSRLSMPAGSRPGALTMAPDFRYMAVALIGGDSRSGSILPRDEIRIIDPAGFTVSKVIKLPADPLPSNLSPFSKLALTEDGKIGLITDHTFSSIQPNMGELALDNAMLVDMEKGEIIEIIGPDESSRHFLQVSGIPGTAVLTPDGKRFVVVGAMGITWIDIEEKKAATYYPMPSDFRASSRPAFSPDGKWMYVAIPLYDMLVKFSTENPEDEFGPTDVGRNLRPYEEGEIPLPAAPLEVAITPDGEVIAVLNFNEGTIDLLHDNQVVPYPLLLHTGNWFSGVAMANNGEEASEVIATGFTAGGIPYQDIIATEDVVEYVNPKEITLQPGEQRVFTAADLLEPAEGQTVDGSLFVDSQHAGITGFFMVGDQEAKRLDGAVTLAESDYHNFYILPDIRVTDGFNTEIAVMVPSYGIGAAFVTFTLYDHAGEELAKETQQIPPRGIRRILVKDPDGPGGEAGLFADSVLENFVDGYLTVWSARKLIALQRTYDTERMSVLNGLPIGPDQNQATSLFLPQIAHFSGAETFVNVVNTGEETATVRLSLHGDSGGVVAGPVPVTLEEGRGARRNLAAIFGLSDPGHLVTGWVKIESDQPGIVGNAEVRAFHGKAMTTIPAQARASRHFVFSHLAHGDGFSTGLAFLNPGTADALVEVRVYQADGTLSSSMNLPLRGGERISRLMDEHFPGFEQSGGRVVVRSNQPVFGLEIFFSNDQEIMSAVPAQLLD